MSKPIKRRLFIFIGLLASCFLLAYILLSSRFPDTSFLAISISAFLQQNRTEPKLILTWTPFFGQPMGKSYLEGCPFRNVCSITWKQSDYEKADALVFHPMDMNLRNLPRRRNSKQLYVFLSHESPPHTSQNAYAIGNFFNWTMTYRLDSDVPFPYSYIGKGQPSSQPTDLNATILQGKKHPKLLAWFVSNCYTHSKREQYVDALGKYIPVDIYGQCGKLSCPRRSQNTCDKLLDEQYKFYIAFENSLCLDYATEKFYSRAYLNAVPVVLKRSLVERLFPKGSYVAASDFSHPKFLAAYLRYLDSNQTAYLEYFRWRNEGYQFQQHDQQGNYFGFCGLCQKMLKGSYDTKSYPDLRKWWLEGSQCDQELVSRLLSLKDP